MELGIDCSGFVSVQYRRFVRTVIPKEVVAMNRPPLTDRSRVRSERLVMRLRPIERERWIAEAKSAGMSLAEWIRVECNKASSSGTEDA
jgi:hypothetical protein